ncbi:MAG: hypothetical protein Q8M26_02245 [Pseudolabrys sp.]|nr:hypothetical protein [Pseudolabrys sp.]
MNRAKDYISFAGWFMGIGYAVMWPFTASSRSGQPFGASVLCGDEALTGWLCPASYPLRMPEELHALGFVAALFVAVRLVTYAIRRLRRRRQNLALVPPSDVPIVPAPEVVVRPRLRPPAPPPHRSVKPRSHFGLRNVPR